MTTALWALLALVGQLALLLLTHAGHTVGYQHFTPLAGSDALHTLARVVLILQAVLVAAALVRRREAVAETLGSLAPGWWLALLTICFVMTGATLSRDPRAYALELVLAGIAEAAQLATVALAVASMPPARLDAFRRWTMPSGGEAVEPGGWDPIAPWLALWTVVIAYLMAVVSYQRMPHIPDEVVYLLHGRYFARGMLTMPAPPVPDAFNLDLMSLEGGRWFCPVPPGWPAVLALGVALGEPWLVNPVLAGLSVLLASLLLREIYPRRTARLILVLLAVSPWALLMGMNLLTHCLSTVAALLAAVGVARLRRGRPIAWAALAGAMIGLLSLIRPLEAVAVAALLGLWSLRARWRGVMLVPSAVLTMSAAVVGAINLPYNRALTGKPTTFPLMAYSDKLWGPGSNSLGFGPNKGAGWNGLDPFPGHGLRDVLVNTNINLYQINIELLGWGCGSLIAVWLLFSAGRLTRTDRQMVAVIATVIGLHAFYWFSGGPDFGARYWYLVLLPCLALAARGIESADAALARLGRAGSAGAAAALLVALAMVLFMPWRAVDKYWHYRGMRPDIRTMAREQPFGADLVLIRGERQPDYHGAAVFNPVDLRAPVPVYAWDRGPAVDSALLAAYPDRRVWILDGPTRSGDGYRVVAGPLAPAEARRTLAAP